jgi:hypothetical protein
VALVGASASALDLRSGYGVLRPALFASAVQPAMRFTYLLLSGYDGPACIIDAGDYSTRLAFRTSPWHVIRLDDTRTECLASASVIVLIRQDNRLLKPELERLYSDLASNEFIEGTEYRFGVYEASMLRRQLGLFNIQDNQYSVIRYVRQVRSFSRNNS